MPHRARDSSNRPSDAFNGGVEEGAADVGREERGERGEGGGAA